ncbi:MAG: hypothetical protein ACTSYR_04005 [Candidatus Odinarchaeia archaeon]
MEMVFMKILKIKRYDKHCAIHNDVERNDTIDYWCRLKKIKISTVRTALEEGKNLNEILGLTSLNKLSLADAIKQFNY